MTVFDRSWYGRVLVERVEGFASEEQWRRAYEEIGAFERALAEEGTIVVKLWLHISAEEQLKRFEGRAEDPLKAWKLTAEDWENREQARRLRGGGGGDARPHRPPARARWRLVAAESKRYARVQVVRDRERGNRSGDAALGPGAAADRPRIPASTPSLDHEEPYPLSRFRIFALLAALAALATAFAACGGSGSSSEDPQKVIDERHPQRGRKRQPRRLARRQVRRRRRRRPQRQPLRPVPERRQGKPAAARHDRQGRAARSRRRHRLRRRPDAALRPRLRQLQGHRVRSRPDHLRLRQVRLRTGPAARRLRRQRRPTSPPARKRRPGSRSATSSTT